ncbi:hypothetical protein P389DRAFT_188855 [Cystobasidium minutum MCA 4210]|uniref:uncharacterized protein n=1 Tax=Cystobasidium minutum MCA 4210 TaxID=1397322 RepID=UPI0034CE9ED3|eukprot:jgi/Rhomi1/188855/estExt_fgenesh1_pg.C_3_t10271
MMFLSLVNVSALAAVGLAMPVIPNADAPATTLAKRLDLPPPGKVCLTLGQNLAPGTGACGPIPNAKGLPIIALPMSIFDLYRPNPDDRNGNHNLLCGKEVRLTNNDNNVTISAIVADRNEAPPERQACSDEHTQYGPTSIDVDKAGYAQLGAADDRSLIDPAHPNELPVLSYSFVL